MATKTGIITINGIQAIECDSDPSIGGLVAAIGSYASATDGSGIFYKSASSNTAWTQVIMPSTIPTRITNLENNVYKITYFQIVTGTSGSLTVPTGATINEGQFGLSGNAALSKVDVSNLPTFQSPTTSGGVIVTASLNVSTGAWVASGVYTDVSVALIYSINISALNYHNLDTTKIINEVQQNALTSSEFGNFIYSLTPKSTLNDNDEFIISDSVDSNKSKSTLWSNVKINFGSATITLTNKRITPRVTVITSSATPTINTDNCDAVTITALASDITSMTTNLSGTPNNFDKLIIRIKDNGTARAITWGASFANYGGILPPTTVINKTTHVGLQWDSVALVWCCLSSVTQP